MVRCPNCGAQYEEGLLHCPYCKSVDDYQDESEYLEDLDELRDKLEDIPEDVLRDHKKNQTIEAARDFTKILKVIGIAALIILVMVGASKLIDRQVYGIDNTQRQKEEYLWKQENFPKLDELYENKDYEGILDMVNNTDNAGVYDWEHYPLVEGLRILEYLPGDIRLLGELEAQGKAGTNSYLDTQTSVLRDELCLMYFDQREADAADVELIRELSAEYLQDLETRFALSQEEQDAFAAKARKDRGYFYLSECKDFLKNR